VVTIHNWRELALLGRAKAPFSPTPIRPRRIASRVAAKSCAHRDALPRAFIEPPIVRWSAILISLFFRHDSSRHAMARIRRVSDWPRSRFSARGPGWPACPQRAKRGTIRTVVRDMRLKMAVNGSRWQFFGRGSRLAARATVPPTCGALLGNASEPDPSPAGRARPWRHSRVRCAPCHSDQTSRLE
jgi:hypothetical protein